MSERIECDREGDFRAEILEYGLQKADSGAVGVRMCFRLTAMWNTESQQWDDWSQWNVVAWGSQWIIKKDQKVNTRTVESLSRNCGWDGSLGSIVNNTWEPTPCQVSVKAEEYEGNTSHRVAFVNPFDRIPGANVGNVDIDGLKALEQQFGSSLRAVVGNVKRNTAPPQAVNSKSGPKAPPKPTQAMETVPPAANEQDEIPF